MKNKILNIFTIIMVFSILMPTSVVGNPSTPPKITVLESDIIVKETYAQTSLDLGAAYHTPDGRISVIVELQQPPLGLAHGQKLDLASPNRQDYLLKLVQQQDQVISEIATLVPGAEVRSRYNAAFNGFQVLVAPTKAAALLKLDAVKRVYPDRRRSLLLDSSTEVINAPAIWADLGGPSNAGEGIRIAVIDTGIRSENPMFEGTDFIQPPGFPHGYCTDFPADPEFQCNDKLIVARYYEPIFNIHADETRSPLDIHGHGSHVAGIAAGNLVDVPAGVVVPETTTISGVAPKAYLMVYKALFVEPDSGVAGSDSMFLAALDDALLDGADVINNSWGESENRNPADSPYQTVLAALNAAGVVVVFAAGNGGPNESTIHCPGCLEDALTVGATTADRIYANTLDVLWPMEVPDNLKGLAALSGTGPEITENIDASIVYSGAADPGNVEGCSPFVEGTFANSIALIPRGSCLFIEKVTNAWSAGAIAVVIFNNEPGFPIRMMNLQTTSIPAVFMSKDQGESLRDWVTAMSLPMARINTEVTAVRNSYWQDLLLESSSAGPNGDPNVLKPDIVAPGFYILSATSPVSSGGQDYQFFEGTSMAAPHISGAAALMIQKHPTWTPQQIKTALTSTANPQVYQPDGSTPATPFMMGAGRLDLAAGSNTGLTFSQPSFANSQCHGQCSFVATVKNETLNNNSWWDVIVDAPLGLNVQVEPSFMILGLGETRTFRVTVDVTDVLLDQWYFGNIGWQQKFETHADANLPLAVFSTEPDQASLAKKADRFFAAPGDTATYTISLINDVPLTTTFTISDPIPTNASFVPGSATGGLVYDPIADELVATVELSGVKMDLVPDSLYGYFSLSDYADPEPCPDMDCDEGTIMLTGFDFFYNGREVNDLVWSTNGYIQVSTDSPDLSSFNQNLPDPVAPNNVIAPLWADLDTHACSLGSEKAGWYRGSATDGTFIYDIVEWKEVALKSDPTICFSFQIWMKKGTDEIWFVYGPQTGTITTATVGLENQHGSAGYTHFYNGSGTAPTEGTTLKAVHDVGQVNFTYALELGPTLGVDVTNTVQAFNTRTESVISASTMVRVAKHIFLPFLIR